MVLNEFIAYAQLGPMKAQLDRVVHDRLVRPWRLANFQLVGIQLGGIGALARTGKATWPRSASRDARGHARHFLSATNRGHAP